jgi:hypothetical protein
MINGVVRRRMTWEGHSNNNNSVALFLRKQPRNGVKEERVALETRYFFFLGYGKTPRHCSTAGQLSDASLASMRLAPVCPSVFVSRWFL